MHLYKNQSADLSDWPAYSQMLTLQSHSPSCPLGHGVFWQSAVRCVPRELLLLILAWVTRDWEHCWWGTTWCFFLPLAQPAGCRERVAARQSFEATCPTQPQAQPQLHLSFTNCLFKFHDRSVSLIYLNKLKFLLFVPLHSLNVFLSFHYFLRVSQQLF